MNKKRRKKRALIIIIIFLIAASFILYYLLFVNSSKSSKVIDEIKGYNYTLSKRDTELMKENFSKLKELLEKEQIDYNKYAEYLSKLFVIDLFTINNKNSKYDVGSLEYIYPDHRDNFSLNVKDTLYKYVTEDHKDLPEVKSIKVLESEEVSYEYNEEEYSAYKLLLSWDYVKDLDYDEKATITIIKVDDKLYVAEYVSEVEE